MTGGDCVSVSVVGGGCVVGEVTGMGEEGVGDRDGTGPTGCNKEVVDSNDEGDGDGVGASSPPSPKVCVVEEEEEGDGPALLEGLMSLLPLLSTICWVCVALLGCGDGTALVVGIVAVAVAGHDTSNLDADVPQCVEHLKYLVVPGAADSSSFVYSASCHELWYPVICALTVELVHELPCVS